ncbi:MAG: hypothetical protein Q8P54_02770 [bacterium]|nr:hypothetical protein [bacterium]
MTFIDKVTESAGILKNIDDLIKVLEVIGYKVKKHKLRDGELDKKDWKVYTAERGELPPLILMFAKDAPIANVSFRAPGYDANVLKKREFYETLNQTNQAAYFSKWCYGNDTNGGLLTLYIQTQYYGYEKEIFGGLIKMFNRDIEEYIDGFAKFTLKE